jgi:hypothetical protein
MSVEPDVIIIAGSPVAQRTVANTVMSFRSQLPEIRYQSVSRPICALVLRDELLSHPFSTWESS